MIRDTVAPWPDSILVQGRTPFGAPAKTVESAARVEYRFDRGWYTRAIEAESERWP